MGANKSVSLSDAIDDYMWHRRSLDLAKSTLKGDEMTLRQLLNLSGNVMLHMVSANHVIRFFEEGAKTRQPQTLGNDHTRLSVFFAWARATGRMSKSSDPMYGRRKPRGTTRERNRVPVGKFAALLDAAGERDPRDRMALAMLLYTLGRDSEVAAVRIRDVDLDSGFVHVTVQKTREEDRVPICAELDRELRLWLTYYTEQVGFLEPHFFLVPSRKTTGIYEDGKVARTRTLHYRPERRVQPLATIANPALTRIGFPIKDEKGRSCGEGAHTVRRSGARALFDQLCVSGYDRSLRLVQSLLHHKTVTTTEIYLGITADKRSRDEVLKGKPMYDLGDNVVSLTKASASL